MLLPVLATVNGSALGSAAGRESVHVRTAG
jgi:hypothetical protein